MTEQVHVMTTKHIFSFSDYCSCVLCVVVGFLHSVGVVVLLYVVVVVVICM